LANISVSENCVLKTGSRLMSGASMGGCSMLLEHTLILSGDSVDAYTVWQGWPSKVQVRLDDYQKRLNARLRRLQLLDKEACLTSMCNLRHRCFCCCIGKAKGGEVQSSLRITSTSSTVRYILSGDEDEVDFPHEGTMLLGEKV
jgi:hypothetical protein